MEEKVMQRSTLDVWRKLLDPSRDECPQSMYQKAVCAGAQYLCTGGDDLHKGLSVPVQGTGFLWLTLRLLVNKIPEKVCNNPIRFDTDWRVICDTTLL